MHCIQRSISERPLIWAWGERVTHPGGPPRPLKVMPPLLLPLLQLLLQVQRRPQLQNPASSLLLLQPLAFSTNSAVGF